MQQLNKYPSSKNFTLFSKDITINVSDELFNSSSVISAKQNLSITANKVTKLVKDGLCRLEIGHKQ
jgi:hypothetical protein